MSRVKVLYVEDELFLGKIEELIVRIENALRVGKDNSANHLIADIISIGSYKFNLNRQVLVCNNEERKLSYRESELLKYLWQNRNNIIDRREIMNFIWGNDSFFNSRNLDVYITRLRGYLYVKEDYQIPGNTEFLWIFFGSNYSLIFL